MGANSESYFLRLVQLENTHRNGYTRNHDDRVAQMQFPLGWAFFSRVNVDKLLKQLSSQVKGVDFQYICPVMQWAYDTRGRLWEQETAIQPYVKQLNELVVKRVLTVLAGDKRGQIQSVNVFFGRDMRSYDRPFYEPSKRVEERGSMVLSQADPAADPGNMFGA